ncbi:bifunctional serine/threonine-protein kinase/ABC transporter substrate-binding protein [Streptomyces sp. TS71-3]|uniref:bifunctional serine/threonine-protein kinase/ABC transporter substrate-binding protein n=1 Tax=Streptomyces sp. TS71-3 TaxID=2733862 RepID=UPI001B02E1BF|nr:bifunctional serine/threonine-protein kinase/ABC transporter substrate-binding protein [Streptomyces sp. TS71-3]GHJ35671.1 hypothetical protein Sm713_12800 [Streptomyces sp. TS71-3]
MEPLLPSDPAWLGEHRPLRQLGAGGMGVVYLARAASGELAAVKVIQPEYAGEPEFRARFRREAAAARRVDSPWVVRVTGADPEASAPWLATAFVPGPSLAEAVASCGALPVPAVRVLGGVLGRALAAVHAVDLVHRDVKPGNVLLALEGPRLIDFGIARSTSADQTPLTSPDVVVGTPGFLSPEQARAGRAGPASDVFALGCVLAFAATGRPPFGTGTANAVMYRTVHGRPDLDGITDAPLRALLLRCLDKDAAARPPAAEAAGALAADEPAGSVDWLPDPVVRMVADRSAELLELPPVAPTEVSEPQEGEPPPDPARTPGPPDPAAVPGRRRFLALAAGGTAVLAAGGGTAAWWALRRNGSGAAGSGDGPVLGVQADLSGPQRTAGRAQEQAARLAVEQFNSRTDRPFTLGLRVEDDGGTSAGARTAAERLTGDANVLAVLGPTGWTTAQGAVETYERAGTPLLTVSEGSVSAADGALVTVPRMYFHAAPLGSVAGYLTDAALAAEGARRPGLLVDRASGLAGWETSQMAYGMAPGRKLHVYARHVPATAPDPSTVLADMLGRGVDGIYYLGTPERAALVARALALRGFDGPRFLDHPAATDAFTAAAGRAAEGWRAVTPYIGPDAAPVRAFATAYRKRYGTAPGIWAAEAYDVARLVADRLTALRRGGGRPGRAGLAAALLKADFKGLTATYAFEQDRTLRLGHLYQWRVTGGRFRYAGEVPVA